MQCHVMSCKVRSFFVKETVPYLRTQRSFFSQNFWKSKNFVESCMCSLCDVLFRFHFGNWVQSMFFQIFTSEGVGGRVFPLFV